jgi:hypothetical protein
LSSWRAPVLGGASVLFRRAFGEQLLELRQGITTFFQQTSFHSGLQYPDDQSFTSIEYLENVTGCVV